MPPAGRLAPEKTLFFMEERLQMAVKTAAASVRRMLFDMGGSTANLQALAQKTKATAGRRFSASVDDDTLKA